MKTDEFDLQLFSTPGPIDETPGDEDELPDDLADEAVEPAVVGAEEEEEEMPDDLLTETELLERRAARGTQEPLEPAARQRERDDDRSALVSELRDIFGTLAQPQPAHREAEQPRQYQPPPPPSPEKLQELTDKILSEPGGLAKALLWSRKMGAQDALAQMAGSSEGRAAMEASADTFVQNFISRTVNDPNTKFAKATRPVFESMLEEMDLTPLVSMTREDRNSWLRETWERAGFRAITRSAGTKKPPSPGVARGAGARPGGPGAGRGRVVLRMSDQQKRDMRAASPQLFAGPEGEKRFLRQVWEIEHGVTSSAQVRSMTRDSMRFSDAVNFGG